MERAAAIKKLGKLLGKNMGYRVDPTAPRQDERDEARAALMPAIAERDALRKARDERSAAILAADAEFQRLSAEAKAASDRTAKLSAVTRHYKITVGTMNSMFFSVAAEGDTWEQAIERVQAKQTPPRVGEPV